MPWWGSSSGVVRRSPAMTTKKDIEEEVSSEDSDEDMPDLEVRDPPEPEDAQRKAIWTGWRFWELSSS